MECALKTMDKNHDLNIRTDQPVHKGKVRSVYWLTAADSARLIKERGYPNIAADAMLAVMVISDRISAYECIWHGENGLAGVPGKGAALNAISKHWFDLFRERGLADCHVLEVPHPYVWVVQRARPVMIEAISRQYITGSMWRSYAKGDRVFCGITLPDGLEKDQKLDTLLITPSTKGILTGIPGVPAQDDVNVSREDIVNNLEAFRFQSRDDVAHYEILLRDGFNLISEELAKVNQIFVDTKFEFGYVKDKAGIERLIYMDEIGTPDSSRIWDAAAYAEGRVVENSKEGFRKALQQHFPDPDILLNKNRMDERKTLATSTTLPVDMLLEVSRTYSDIAETITGRKVHIPQDPRAEILRVLKDEFLLIDEEYP
eukprot:m.152152 g.152152  ORF g.152152 m.152152 type:complete len:373 (+) comp17888_c0_seq4:90-1208(+)